MSENASQDDTRTSTDADELEDPDRRPRINEMFASTALDDDSLHFRPGPWSGPVFTTRDEDGEGRLGELLGYLDGEHTVEEIVAAFDDEEEVRDTIDALFDQGIVVDETHPQVNTDNPVWEYMTLNTFFGVEEFEAFREADVLFVNDGEIGPSVLENVVTAGVGSARIVEPRAESTTVRTTSIDADRCETLPPDADMRPAFESANMVVFTADSACRSLVDRVNRLAHETETPFIPGQVQGFDAILGPAVVPGETACYECFRQRVRGNVINREGYEAYLDVTENGTPTQTVPGFADLVAGHLTTHLFGMLSVGIDSLVESVYAFDMFDLSMTTEDVLRLPRCEVCSPAPTLDENRHITLEDVIEKQLKQNDDR